MVQVLQAPEHERVQFTMCTPRAPLTDSGLVMAVEGNMYQVGSPNIFPQDIQICRASAHKHSAAPAALGLSNCLNPAHLHDAQGLTYSLP